MSGSWTKGRDKFFPWETWLVNYEWYWGIAIWSCADTLDFSFRAEKMFYVKILLILPKFHEKILSFSGDVKIFLLGRRMYMYTLPLFMDEVLSEETQLMKWVGIFQVRIFWVGIFRGKIFQGGVFCQILNSRSFKLLAISWNTTI